MLRKKLLAWLGLLVVGFIAGAVISIFLLQNVLRQLDAMNADATAMIDGVQDISTDVATLESVIEDSRTGIAPDERVVLDVADQLSVTLRELENHPLLSMPGEASEAMMRVRSLVPGVIEAARLGGEAAKVHGITTTVTEATNTLARVLRRRVAAEQLDLSRNLRLLIIGLTIGALMMVNITVLVLIRTANMILRPVGELVEGSRELGTENFSHRVTVGQDDEFGELAHAYNRLASELEANEERKVQALRHLAVTLNHELNNVINVIELQLQLVGRRTGGDPAMEGHLRGIRENLGRMARTIASLRSVRRIVLTDYLPGEKMIDLPRSVEDGAPRPASGAKAGGA